jgi:predicted ATP-dependent protease
VGKIEIIPVVSMREVLDHALTGGVKKDSLLKKLADLGEKFSPTPAKVPIC